MEHFDCIFMDIQMPKMDGVTATKFIRGCEQTIIPRGSQYEKLLLKRLHSKIYDTHTPIIALTANVFQSDKQKYLAAGMDDYLGKPIRGKDIHQALLRVAEHIDYEDYFAILETWDKYLNNNLSLPFDAEVSEYQDKGPLQQGNKIRVYELIRSNENYGIIIKLRLNRKVYHFPLCDITVINKKSNNYILIDDYCTWFANR